MQQIYHSITSETLTLTVIVATITLLNYTLFRQTKYQSPDNQNLLMKCHLLLQNFIHIFIKVLLNLNWGLLPASSREQSTKPLLPFQTIDWHKHWKEYNYRKNI